MRYFLEISYDGTAYHGWQYQNNAISIQQVLSEALSTILRSDVKIVGSGRTDAGVHASQQFAHFDFEKELLLDLCYRLNGYLPKDIAVHSLKEVHNDTNARFQAKSRSYIYRMHKSKSPFKTGRSFLFDRPLDLSLMNECCELIKNWEDFQSFSKVHTDVATFNCEIFEARWEESNDGFTFYVSANRFLRGMVRALVGTMLEVGEGKKSVEDFLQILKSKDRRQAGSSAPAHGLYLSRVEYPNEIYV